MTTPTRPKMRICGNYPVDKLGNRLHEGDRVLYARAKGDRAWLAEMEVAEVIIFDPKPGCATIPARVRVKQLKSDAWPLDVMIYSPERRLVKIGERATVWSSNIDEPTKGTRP